MRAIVCGGRGYTNRGNIKYALERYGVTVVIEGGAKGADKIARQLAQEMGLGLVTFPARWNKHGKAAGPIRNKRMLVDGKPDIVLAFPTSESRGTWDMIRKAQKAGVTVILHK